MGAPDVLRKTGLRAVEIRSRLFHVEPLTAERLR